MITAAECAALTAGVRAGEFDRGRLERPALDHRACGAAPPAMISVMDTGAVDRADTIKLLQCILADLPRLPGPRADPYRPCVPYIAETTVKSLRLRLYARALTLASATGFIVVHGTRPFLVTNHHVVTGLNQMTGEFMGKHAVHSEMMEISHHKLGQVGQHVVVSEPLYDRLAGLGG